VSMATIYGQKRANKLKQAIFIKKTIFSKKGTTNHKTLIKSQRPRTQVRLLPKKSFLSLLEKLFFLSS